MEDTRSEWAMGAYRRIKLTHGSPEKAPEWGAIIWHLTAARNWYESLDRKTPHETAIFEEISQMLSGGERCD